MVRGDGLESKLLGRRLAWLVEWASHVLRLCSGPGFDSRPGSLCCMSLPLSLTLFPVTLFSCTVNKGKKNIDRTDVPWKVELYVKLGMRIVIGKQQPISCCFFIWPSSWSGRWVWPSTVLWTGDWMRVRSGSLARSWSASSNAWLGGNKVERITAPLGTVQQTRGTVAKRRRRRKKKSRKE